MELPKMIGAAIALTGFLALVLYVYRQKAAQKKKEEEQRVRTEILERERREETRRYEEFLNKLNFRGEEAAPVPVLQLSEDRSVILSCNTVFLKDLGHPARVYKADLFCPVYIGRSRENDICIREESVSRQHMRIFRSSAFVYAENLSSLNGTFLDGKKLTGPQRIVSGSRLSLGRVELEVEID